MLTKKKTTPREAPTEISAQHIAQPLQGSSDPAL